MSIITARGVAYSFSNGRELFNDLNFSLDAKLTALVGPNGVGKTCLAKLCAGQMQPTAGVIRRETAVKLFPQRVEPENIAVHEYLSTEYEWSPLGGRLLEKIDRQASCLSLSGGQWMRVRLARALNDGFLILDEPTNDLDQEGRSAVTQFLRHHRDGALLISHDRACLQLCEEILELSNRGLAKFGGGWSAYLAAKQQERERLLAAVDRAKREQDLALADRVEQQARQEKRSRRGAASAARGGAPKILLGARKRRAQRSAGKLDVAMLQRSADTVRQARAAVSEVKIEPIMYADLIGHEIPAQKLIAEARNFNIRRREWIYREDLNFSWRGNARIALKGGNGSGKSTLLKALLGDAFEIRGQLRRGNLAALYLDQQCSLLDGERSVFENVRAASSGTDVEIRNGLARFLFAKESVFQKVKELSGGERLRAALARSFLSRHKPELMLLDEPTNNLDLTNIEFLENLAREFHGALIVVSHDQEFLERCGITQEFIL